MVGPSDSTPEESLTGTGKAVGTVDYMPPEQADSARSVDQRADIYSLGCTLFYLLTGRTLYHGDTLVSRLLAHREAPIPSLRAERNDVPEKLEAVFQKMVAKTPEDRYMSMTEVTAELQECAAARYRQFEATTSFHSETPAHVAVQTHDAVETDQTPAEDSIPLDLPVVSPVDGLLATHTRNKRRIIAASLAAPAAFLLLLLFSVVFTIRTPDGTLILELNEPDATVEVLDQQNRVEITRRNDKQNISIEVDPGKHRLKVTKDGFQFFTRDFTIESGGSKTIRARLERLTPERLLRTLLGHTAGVTCVAFRPDGSLLASGSEDKTVKLWDLATGKLRRTLQHTLWVPSVAFSPDGSLLAAANGADTIKLFDVATGKPRRILTMGHPLCATALAFSPDGSILAAAVSDHSLRLWEVATRKPPTTLRPKGRRSDWSHRPVAFSPDGSILAFGSQDGTVTLWDPATGKLRQTLEGHTDRVPSLAFSPDGSTLASGGEDKTVKLWDLATGKLRRTLPGHNATVWSLAFSPDGSTLAAGSLDGIVRFSDVATGELRGRLNAHTKSVKSVAFSPDGSMLASGGADNTVKLWDVSKLEQAEAANPDRRAAEWVLGIGGSLEVSVVGRVRPVKHLDDLPEGLFQITRVYANNTQAISEDLKSLDGLTSLVYLNLSQTHVADNGLEHLKGLSELRSLWLTGTKVGDPGLKHLKGLKKLRILGLRSTLVTATGVADLQAALPNCRILVNSD